MSLSRDTLNTLELLQDLYYSGNTGLISDILKVDFPRTTSNKLALESYGNTDLSQQIDFLWNETETSFTLNTENNSDTFPENSSSTTNTPIKSNSDRFSEEQNGSSTVNTSLITRLKNLDLNTENNSDTFPENQNSSSTNTPIKNNYDTFYEEQNLSSTVNIAFITRLENLEKRVRELELNKMIADKEKENLKKRVRELELNKMIEDKKIELQEENPMYQGSLTGTDTYNLTALVDKNGNEVYWNLAEPNYDKAYITIIENILCDTYDLKNRKDIYGELCASSSSSSSCNILPPPGSTVLYGLVMSTNRFDDRLKKKFLKNLRTNKVNVIVFIFRRARGAYLDVEEIVDGGGVPVTTIPFMVNQKRLSQDVSGLSQEEEDSLKPGYAKSLITLKDELGLKKPESKERKRFDLTKFKR